jgi:hypothetical protein
VRDARRMCDHARMPRIPKNPVAAGMFAYGMWLKLTPQQRKLLLEAARTHGPKVASAAKTHGPKVASAAIAVAASRKKR